MNGASGEAVDLGGEFSGVRLAGLILARLGKIGFKRLQLTQLGVEFALQREGLAETLFVAGKPLGGVACPTFLFLEIGLEMLEDMFEPRDQPCLGQIGFDPYLLVEIRAEQDQARLDLAEVAPTDVAAQLETAGRAERQFPLLARTFGEPELGQDQCAGGPALADEASFPIQREGVAACAGPPFYVLSDA